MPEQQMEHLQQLTELIQKTKPYVRFDKAPTFRKINDEHIAKLTALQLVKIIDQPVMIQSFAASIGKSILSPFEETNELEQDVKKNNIQCGLGIVRMLLNEGIVSKSLDKEVIGTFADGNPKYKTFQRGKYQMFIKHWNLRVTNKDFVEGLFYELPVDLNYKGLPTVNQPKKRVKFFDYEAGPLVANLDRKYIKRFSARKLPIVYKQINELQNIKWTINEDVLNAIEACKHLPLFTFEDKLNLQGDALSGLQRDLNCTLSIARELGKKQFYFYWYLDTRGRYYCSSNYLTPQGGKTSKSLLKFADKKRLGKDGWFWLLVHTANCAGQDKLPIDDRFSWSQSNLERFCDVANDVVNTYHYWSEMDDPQGFLAACFEIRDAMLLDNKEDFESGLPIGFDATTSGLQIMSMMSRDEITGTLCNLTDSDKVGDIYLYIADKVWESDTLPEFWKNLYDKRRKIVKRSVMTFFYSCGKKTMGKHIYSDFKTEFDGITEELTLSLGSRIHGACSKHLPGPSSIMRMFIHLGEDLAIDNKLLFLQGIHNDFPFIQSYTIPEKSRVDFKIDKKKLQLSYISKEGATIDNDKVSTGSSPNVVHHLDSQIVSKLLSITDYTVSPVHDCFMCVAADASKMFEDTRIAFQELFGQQDVLQDICDKYKIDNTIKYGQLDVDAVIDNQYAFS